MSRSTVPLGVYLPCTGYSSVYRINPDGSGALGLTDASHAMLQLDFQLGAKTLHLFEINGSGHSIERLRILD